MHKEFYIGCFGVLIALEFFCVLCLRAWTHTRILNPKAGIKILICLICRTSGKAIIPAPIARAAARAAASARAAVSLNAISGRPEPPSAAAVAVDRPPPAKATAKADPPQAAATARPGSAPRPIARRPGGAGAERAGVRVPLNPAALQRRRAATAPEASTAAVDFVPASIWQTKKADPSDDGASSPSPPTAAAAAAGVDAAATVPEHPGEPSPSAAAAAANDPGGSELPVPAAAAIAAAGEAPTGSGRRALRLDPASVPKRAGVRVGKAVGDGSSAGEKGGAAWAKAREKELLTLRVSDLKPICAKYKVKVSGLKLDLVQRILQHEAKLREH